MLSESYAIKHYMERKRLINFDKIYLLQRNIRFSSSSLDGLEIQVELSNFNSSCVEDGTSIKMVKVENFYFFLSQINIRNKTKRNVKYRSKARKVITTCQKHLV